MDPTPRTDDDLLDLWLAGRPMTTRAAYSADAALLLATVKKPLAQIHSEDLVRFAHGLRGAKTSQARRIASLKSLFGFGVRLGFLAENPTLVLRGPRTEGCIRERILEEDEVMLVIAEAAPGRDRCLVRTLYLSGVRLSEAIGIKFMDVGRRWISVRGKGSRIRTVVVPEDLVTELHQLRWKADRDDAYVFRGASGRPISGRFARRIVRQAAEEALGKPISPHWLRHSHATHAIERGAPIHLVQNSLGHASLATTAAYLHVRPNQGSSQYLRV